MRVQPNPASMIDERRQVHESDADPCELDVVVATDAHRWGRADSTRRQPPAKHFHPSLPHVAMNASGISVPGRVHTARSNRLLCDPIQQQSVGHVVGRRGAVIQTIELNQYTQAFPGGLGAAHIRIDRQQFDLMGIPAQYFCIDAHNQLRCALAAQAIEQIVINKGQV